VRYDGLLQGCHPRKSGDLLVFFFRFFANLYLFLDEGGWYEFFQNSIANNTLCHVLRGW
jgi:hypothetical protein